MRTATSTRKITTFASLFLLLAFSPLPDAPVAEAAAKGDIEAVRALLREGADVNAAQGDGLTALHWAALNGDGELAEVLLYAGANPEPTTRLGGYTPLHQASQSGATEVVEALLRAGADAERLTTTGVRPIHFAAESGNGATVQVLIDAGASIDVRDTYMGLTPLMFATAYDRVEAIAVLLAAGADTEATSSVVDYSDRSKQDRIERQRRDRVIEAQKDPAPEPELEEPDVIQGKAEEKKKDDTKAPGEPTTKPDQDPDSPTPPEPIRADRPDPNNENQPQPLSYDDIVGRQGGFQALHFAARDGRIEAAEALLDAGADINGRTAGDQSTPLLVAMINGNFDLGLRLLERGADPNLASEDGAAPLFAVVNSRWAFRTWYPQPTSWRQQEADYLGVMEALLDAGADPNARLDTHLWYAVYNAGRIGVDFTGATPFWRSAYALDVDAMKLLVAHGADPDVSTSKVPQRRFRYLPEDEKEEDPSGLAPVPVGGPAVHPLHAATGVGYGTSRVGQQHVHVPDGWLAAATYLVDELGLDVNVRDHDGYAPLHHAAARGDNHLIEFLVSRGADVTVVSRRGQTTVDMANGPQQRVQPFPETIALLEGYGAINNHNCISC